jgi:hypothetical protein
MEPTGVLLSSFVVMLLVLVAFIIAMGRNGRR